MEKKFYDPTRLKESISVVEFLAKLGFHAVKQSAGESFYHSMVREGDRTPSFCVNDSTGLWFDHGLGKGGDLIELARLLWPGLSFNAVLERLEDLMEGSHMGKDLVIKPVTPDPVVKVPAYQVNEIRPLGEKSLLAFVEFRRLGEIAPAYLKEIHYQINHPEKGKMSFVATGWTNENGGS